MRTYRLSPAEFANDLSGTGAAKSAGRWNLEGTPCLYTSASRALALCECLLSSANDKPDDLVIVTYDIPDELPLLVLKEDQLPSHWLQNPPPVECQQIGNRHLEEKKHVAIRAPSSIVPNEYNYVLNPRFEEFNQVKIVDIVPMDMKQVQI